MKSLKKVLIYALPYWRGGLLNIVYNLFSVIFSIFSLTLFIPVLDIVFNTDKIVKELPSAFVFDWSNVDATKDSLVDYFYYYISKVIIENGQLTALMYISIAIIVAFFLKNVFRYLAMYSVAPLRNGVIMDMRNAMYKQLTVLPLSYFTDRRKGDLMARMTSDVQEVEWAILTSIEMLFREPITIIAYIAVMFFISPHLTLFVMVLLPISGWLIGGVGKKLKSVSARGQVKNGELLSIIEETLSGLRIIKAFNAIDIMNNHFRKHNREYTRLMTKLFRLRDLASPLSEFLGMTVVVIVFYYGGHLVISGDGLGASVFIVYLGIFSQVLTPAKSLTAAYYNLQKGAAAVERIEVIMNADERIVEKVNAISITEMKSDIMFKDVYFKYDSSEDWILKNINLHIDKRKTVAIVGLSGSGKSTMLDLLPRFYDVISGNILIDGIDVRDYKINDLRGMMGIVSQETVLFNETIAYNISMGNSIYTREQVIEAAKIANAHNFIMQNGGYDVNIGERGTKLSGGERQRISIARAVLKNPQILILDEATSNLDTESERLVQDALAKLMNNRTTLVVAHRLSTIMNADEIVVMSKGEIKERGTHESLIALGGEYKKLYEIQGFNR